MINCIDTLLAFKPQTSLISVFPASVLCNSGVLNRPTQAQPTLSRPAINLTPCPLFPQQTVWPPRPPSWAASDTDSDDLEVRSITGSRDRYAGDGYSSASGDEPEQTWSVV